MSGILKRAVSVLLTSTFILASACVVTEPVVVNAQVRTENVESVAQTLRNYSITRLDGSTLPVSEIKEDYVAFIFGRTSCYNCNSMTSYLDKIQSYGRSLHKVFIPVDSADTSFQEFIQNHPGTMTVAKYSVKNWYLEKELSAQAGLEYEAFPDLFILDKNRKLIWSSNSLDSTGLFETFGFKGATDVDISYSIENPKVGDTFKVLVKPTPSDADILEVKATSQDSSIVEVALDGTLIAKGEGYATLAISITYLGVNSYFGSDDMALQTFTTYQYVRINKKNDNAASGTADDNCCDPKSGTDNSQGSDVAPATDGNSSQTTGNDTAANIAKVKKPKASAITSLSKGKKQFTAKWKKVSGVKGYQLQYSTSSKFKSATTRTYERASLTKATIKKLKSKKTYYVRIRTYKMSGGKKVYSSWSKAAKVKTK